MPWWEPHYITVDRELALRFFVTFARFEFALKNSGFFGPQGVPPGELRDAQPDWDAFASSIRDVTLGHAVEADPRPADPSPLPLAQEREGVRHRGRVEVRIRVREILLTHTCDGSPERFLPLARGEKKWLKPEVRSGGEVTHR